MVGRAGGQGRERGPPCVDVCKLLSQQMKSNCHGWRNLDLLIYSPLFFASSPSRLAHDGVTRTTVIMIHSSPPPPLALTSSSGASLPTTRPSSTSSKFPSHSTTLSLSSYSFLTSHDPFSFSSSFLLALFGRTFSAQASHLHRGLSADTRRKASAQAADAEVVVLVLARRLGRGGGAATCRGSR